MKARFNGYTIYALPATVSCLPGTVSTWTACKGYTEHGSTIGGKSSPEGKTWPSPSKAIEAAKRHLAHNA